MTIKTDLAGTTTLTPPGGEYAALLAELDQFSKAMGTESDPGADKKIAAAAADGADTSQATTDAGGTDAGKTGEGEDGDEEFGKSMSVTLADGTTVDAYDGTAMMKALHTENVALRAGLGAVTANSDTLLKGLGVALGIAKTLQTQIGAQDVLIKSLQTDMVRIGGQGTGRKTVLAVHEKLPPAGTVTEPAGLNPKEFMVKAMSAFDRGDLIGTDIARIQARMNNGAPMPDELIQAVAASEQRATTK